MSYRELEGTHVSLNDVHAAIVICELRVFWDVFSRHNDHVMQQVAPAGDTGKGSR